MAIGPFTRRELGILLHPASLYGNEGIGTIGKNAYECVDWIASTGATLWQILPLSPNGKHQSPYFSPSSFCGNPLMVDLQNLYEEKLLDKADVPNKENDQRVDYKNLNKKKMAALLKAAQKLNSSKRHAWYSEYINFCETHEWVHNTSLFYILKDKYKNKPWWKWPKQAKTLNPTFLNKVISENKESMELHKIIFFFFDKQWNELRKYANNKGIRIIGDVPIYVDENSAEVWLNPKCFKLDEDSNMTVVSGVPPDYFSATGQLWGNPIYDWKSMEQNDYSWWRARLKRVLELTDIVRIDHFRGLSAYWEIPAGVDDARKGKWVEGPGQKFFDALKKDFPELPFIAEDLGIMDDAVAKLRDDNHLYGMRILQFGFDGDPYNVNLPHNFPTNCIAYTGTHDNEPVAGWWCNLSDAQRETVSDYYQFRYDWHMGKAAWSLIEAAIASKAEVAIIPIQDFLALGNEARINDPSKFTDNWEWRLPMDTLTEGLAESIKRLKNKYRW